MGVYHLMGLGLSPGAVTGPLSYLGHRYQRWNESDQQFFVHSGEVAHRKAGKKVGDVQTLVLFSSREVLLGKDEKTGKEMLASSYIDNPGGRIASEPECPQVVMKQALRQLLSKIWPDIAGGRSGADLFWCEVDRKNIQNSFERIAQIVMALAGVGSQGKEIWMNLTGGSNVINFALQLVSALSGAVARLYYVQADSQAQNENAIKCVRYTTEEAYWVNLPAMPLRISRLGRGSLKLLSQSGPMPITDLFGKLKNDENYWKFIHDISVEEFREVYLTPMWKQQLVVNDDNGYAIGPQWELVRPYQEILEKFRDQDHTPTLEQLAKREAWLEREYISFST